MKDMSIEKAADVLLGFGGEGTGEELLDYLTTNLGWDDDRAERFVYDLRELYLHLNP